MPFPAPAHSFPTKDQMGDFLEIYAHAFDLPVRSGLWVDCLTKLDGRFILTTNGQRFEAENVVVAMSDWQNPMCLPSLVSWMPAFCRCIPASTRTPRNCRMVVF